ncbi:diguanylate cyclase [Clostridium uliginosum]|uniref:Diguanylate cyclase (GGDEF) domain-containing protein n=1 Tax=Clostridium uliginosum TaxID=119641 RepID=A0A1I1RFG7_9CLOT|nr:diguanylate cyclase [Clostridium uliginosum]SFD33091.1 diguanylate cyclase (GGDEF) domain-containing protein [Clostridium uliginosum]
MKALNNQYLIERCIEIEENFLGYIVTDTCRKKKYDFYIFQNDFEYENYREYLLSNFKTIKNFNFDNVVNLVDIEVVKNIDGINLDKLQYGYLTEHIDYNIDTESYLSKCSISDRFDIFMELCSAVNTLNIKGYIFEELNLKDIILISNKNKTVSVKIKNLLQYEMSKFNMGNLLSMKSLAYPYNVEKQNDEGTPKDNIKEIIYIFKQLFDEKEFYAKFQGLDYIDKVVSLNKVAHIIDFIKYVNKHLNKNYDAFVFDALDKVQTDLDIIGMEDEIKKVEENFKQILSNKLKYKIICFNGEEGTGKTRTIKEIKHKIINKYFKNKLEKPYLLIDNLEELKSSNSVLNSIYKNLDKYLKDKYGVYLKKFIDMLSEEVIVNNENTLQVINRVCKLLHEYTVNTTLIILLDDLEQSKELFKLFFRYLCLLGNKLENIMIIFSTNEDKFDNKMIDFFKELGSLENYEEYKINYFNNYNTSKMVKSMLNSHKNNNRLSMKIYAETLGKPLFISETIKELYKDGTIYLCREDGFWKSRVDIHNIVIPRSVEKTLENKISGLNKNEIETLETLCIYQSALSEKIIFSYIILDDLKKEVYNQLKLKRLLIDKISDTGMRVDFSNDLVKKIIYSKLNEENKIKMHINACNFLEKILSKTDEYLDEFLNQLERCKQWDKLIKYSLKCGKIFDISGNTIKSIYYYKKALTYEQDNNTTKMAISIAKLNEKIGEDKEAYKYFNKANTYAVDNNQKELQIYVLLRMIIITVKECKFVNLTFPLKVVRELLDKTSYPKGEAYYYYALALLAKVEKDKELAIKYSDQVLKICDNNNINVGVYAWTKVLLSQIYINQGRYEETKDLLKDSLGIFTTENNYVGYLSSKINYVLACKESGESCDEVLNAFIEVNKLSNKYKVYKKEVSSLIHIAKIYIEKREYENANKNLLYSLEIAREHGFDRYILRICNLLCESYTKLGKIKLASNYYNLTIELKKGVRLSEMDIINLSSTAALYNCLIYNFDFAIKQLEDVKVLIGDYESFEYLKIKSQYYQLLLHNCTIEEEVKKKFTLLTNETEKFKNRQVKLAIRISAIRTILCLGYKDLAKQLFLNIEKYVRDYDTEMEYVYLELYFRCNNSYNMLINKALRIISFGNNKDMKANLYSLIAEKYEEITCYELAINYYYESINIFINIINSLPEIERILYANNSEFLITYNKFRNCLAETLESDLNLKEVTLINDIFELNGIVEQLKIYNILKNSECFKLMQGFYSKCYYNSIGDVYKILKNFSNDIIKNLEVILKYMARITLADKAMIVMENSLGENEVICEYRISDKNEIQKYFSLKVDATEEILVISNNDDKLNRIDNKILQEGMKACMYVKFSNKGKLINSNERINGKLILISDNAINYINIESKNKVEKIIPFILFLLDQYKLRISSTLDKLTGVYNRKYLETSLRDLIDYSYERNREFSLIIFDIDDFKGVNDRYGHQTGDEVLIKLTKEVKKCLSKKDIFVRYGGEEFILLLPNKGEEASFKVAEIIRKQVEDAKILGDKRKVSISLGIAVYLKHSCNSEELIKIADQALYISKAEGKNKSTIWNENLMVLNNSNNSNSRIKGILPSNYTKDYNLRLATKDIMDMIKKKSGNEEKIYDFLSRIIQITESEFASAFIIKGSSVKNIYSKKRYEEGSSEIQDFNMKLVYDIINNNNGLYLVDWSNTYINQSYGIPDWKSLCITPLICNGEIIAILYLSISVNEKEFNQGDLDLLYYFGQLAISLFC